MYQYCSVFLTVNHRFVGIHRDLGSSRVYVTTAQGRARPAAAPMFSIALVVDRVSPSAGSLFGGQTIKVFGKGFAQKATEADQALARARVRLGGRECRVLRTGLGWIECVTPSSVGANASATSQADSVQGVEVAIVPGQPGGGDAPTRSVHQQCLPDRPCRGNAAPPSTTCAGQFHCAECKVGATDATHCLTCMAGFRHVVQSHADCTGTCVALEHSASQVTIASSARTCRTGVLDRDLGRAIANLPGGALACTAPPRVLPAAARPSQGVGDRAVLPQGTSCTDIESGHACCGAVEYANTAHARCVYGSFTTGGTTAGAVTTHSCQTERWASEHSAWGSVVACPSRTCAWAHNDVTAPAALAPRLHYPLTGGSLPGAPPERFWRAEGGACAPTDTGGFCASTSGFSACFSACADSTVCRAYDVGVGTSGCTLHITDLAAFTPAASWGCWEYSDAASAAALNATIVSERYVECLQNQNGGASCADAYTCRTAVDDVSSHWPSEMHLQGTWRGDKYPSTLHGAGKPTHFHWDGDSSLRLGTLGALGVIKGSAFSAAGWFMPTQADAQVASNGYLLIHEAADCCRGNGKKVGGLDTDAQSPTQCEAGCAALSTCKYFSHSEEWKNCQFCSKCDLTTTGNAARYTSWARTSRLGGEYSKFVLNPAKAQTCDARGLFELTLEQCTAAAAVIGHGALLQHPAGKSYGGGWPKGCFTGHSPAQYFFNTAGTRTTPSSNGRRLCGSHVVKTSLMSAADNTIYTPGLPAGTVRSAARRTPQGRSTSPSTAGPTSRSRTSPRSWCLGCWWTAW